jgi:hypothetical protein
MKLRLEIGGTWQEVGDQIVITQRRPDTPLSQGEAEKFIPCVDDWCRAGPCKCRDNIASLIAERDAAQANAGHAYQQYLGMMAERDKLKEDRDGFEFAFEKWFDYSGDLSAENTELRERVSVLTSLAGNAIADLGRYANDDSPERRLVSFEGYNEELAALTRTSEDVSVTRHGNAPNRS